MQSFTQHVSGEMTEFEESRFYLASNKWQKLLKICNVHYALMPNLYE